MPRDPHDLALRGRDKKDVTKLVHRQIAEAVDLHALVDIGGGDGKMLRISDAAVRTMMCQQQTFVRHH